MTEIQNQFDYNAISVETREFLKQKETAIKARTAQTIIENGLEVKYCWLLAETLYFQGYGELRT